VAKSYAAGVTDEFMEPVLCDREGTIAPEDSVFFFNFRPDRAGKSPGRSSIPPLTPFPGARASFRFILSDKTQYDAQMPTSRSPSGTPPWKTSSARISAGWADAAADRGDGKIRARHLLLHGGEETVYPGEDRVLIPSPGVATYDLKPEMSAYEVAEEAVKRIESGQYDVIALNFANCDMVGHTGVFEAAVKSVEAVDACVGRIVEATGDMGGISVITADHGNAEQMLQADGGSPLPAHTTNLVPVAICGARGPLRNGRRSDVAPTLLDLMGLEKPPGWTGAL
jgi:2,3-bisphosphoglycerate-independent phosphoglycerate mutase